MFKVYRKEMEWGGNKLTLETTKGNVVIELRHGRPQGGADRLLGCLAGSERREQAVDPGDADVSLPRRSWPPKSW